MIVRPHAHMLIEHYIIRHNPRFGTGGLPSLVFTKTPSYTGCSTLSPSCVSCLSLFSLVLACTHPVPRPPLCSLVSLASHSSACDQAASPASLLPGSRLQVLAPEPAHTAQQASERVPRARALMCCSLEVY